MTEIIDNVKHDDILKAGKVLFWKHGIKRVTVEEIAREAGLSKVTFYRYFRNKYDLAKTILELLFEEGMRKYNAIMAQDISFAKKAKEIVEFKIESSKEVSHEFLVDLLKNKKLAPILTELSKKSTEITINDFQKAQKAGEMNPDIKPELILYFLDKIRDMSGDPEFLKLYDTSDVAIGELTNFLFYGLGIKPD